MVTALLGFKLVSENLIAGIFSYALHTENKGLLDNLRGFNGSQEIVTGLIDFICAMFLLYLYTVLGQIDM